MKEERRKREKKAVNSGHLVLWQRTQAARTNLQQNWYLFINPTCVLSIVNQPTNFFWPLLRFTCRKIKPSFYTNKCPLLAGASLHKPTNDHHLFALERNFLWETKILLFYKQFKVCLKCKGYCQMFLMLTTILHY